MIFGLLFLVVGLGGLVGMIIYRKHAPTGSGRLWAAVIVLGLLGAMMTWSGLRILRRGESMPDNPHDPTILD